jgi:hypothetical protein
MTSRTSQLHRINARMDAEIKADPFAYASTRRTLVFQNPGLIDLAAVTTLGVSVKDGDTPIGYFGTGLKFAIATILRGSGTFTLWRGTVAHRFGTEVDNVRGEPFEFVTMDGQRLGFTTQLGRNWKPWMAFRELASNCRDEGGRYFQGEDGWQVEPDHTTIVVGGQELLAVWPDRSSILLDTEPLFANEFVEVHPGNGGFVYYRGVRINEPARQTRFRYNVRTTLELTEDRTAKWEFEVDYAIERGIAAMNDRAMLREVLNCGEGYLEHHLDATRWTPSAEFREVAHELAMGAATNLRANPAAVREARKLALGQLEPGGGASLEPHQQKMLDRAASMLAGAGFNPHDFPVIVVDTLGPNIHGLAEKGRIYLSLLPFQKGTREVAATLLEEYAHLRSGQGDCTRGFQNWLFDQLLVQSERIAGEPF